MSLEPGQKLAHYEVLNSLGAGGMGEVFRARDTRLGREVALKVLSDSVASDPARLARFEREARAVAALNHPNIVVLHSIEEDRGIRFITMELIAGSTLDTVIAPGGLPLRAILEIAVPLVDALAVAHAQGIVHRDLKPSNLMRTSDGRLKVLDFGLAKRSAEALPAESSTVATAPLSAAGQVLGTVPYMAPEQIRGESADPRTDIFALGIVIYELATGRRPFEAATLADVSSAILRDTPVPLNSLRSDLPDRLGRLVARCLAKDARSRFQNAPSVLEELRLVERDSASGLASTPSAPDLIRSIAVLPLDNVSRDPAQEYFADGMTEALISDLARLRRLRVISRTSAMKYKGVQRALPDIARELDVDAILEGSALLVGNRVRINVQLVAARRDEMLWSERYDRDLVDVLSLQSDVAAAVAQEIVLRVTPREAERLAQRTEVNAEAHLEYLKGKHVADAGSPQAIELGLQHFERALRLDPNYAPAWAGVAACHHTRAGRGMALPAEACQQARVAAVRALEIDPLLADAHAVLGAVQALERDLPGAMRSLEKSIELNPGDTHAYHILGRIYYCTERHAEAQEAMLKSIQIDPLSMILHTAVGDAYYYAREFAQSVVYYRRAIGLDPRFDGAHTDLARSLEALGNFEEARVEYEEGRRLAGSVAGPSFGLAHLEASMGHTDAARLILAELTAARSQRVVSAWGIGAVHASLGDVDEAFRWLDIAMDEGATGLIYLRVHPRLDPIRSDPRFPALVRRYGLDRI